ncbi:hypothetical protein CRE_24436 [Caenorhabditis remanei]|uniref:F-box domain-containing protein n=1 Tax=Caenorhabditis remanei TaxID=31234 RepID=E3MG13_CAERE|nr:hypothetical protein CRE_24436 [Caenorhabditis remanei]
MEAGDRHPFPLLRLSDDPLQLVVLLMRRFDQFALSLVSKRSKEVVKSIGLSSRITIKVDEEEVSIRIHKRITENIRCSFADDQVAINNLPSEMVKPTVTSTRGRHTFTRSRKGYRFEDWLSHCLEVFHQSKVTTVFFERLIPHFKSFRKTFESFTILKIVREYTDEEARDLLKLFIPVKKLYLDCNPFTNKDENNKLLQEVFIQNFNHLDLNWRSSLAIDNLLIMNSKVITISSEKLSEHVLNRFIKHWMAGSNPRLEYLELSSDDDRIINEEAVLKGVNYQKMPSTHRRYLENPPFINNPDYAYIDGGYDVRRADGTTASVLFNEYVYFVLVVLN